MLQQFGGPLVVTASGANWNVAARGPLSCYSTGCLAISVSIPKRPPLKLKSVHRIVWCSARRHKFTIFDRDWSMHFHKLWVSSLIVCFWCKIQFFLPTKENVLGLSGSIEPRIGWHLENITKCYNILQNITKHYKPSQTNTKYYNNITTHYNILQQFTT